MKENVSGCFFWTQCSTSYTSQIKSNQITGFHQWL